MKSSELMMSNVTDVRSFLKYTLLTFVMPDIKKWERHVSWMGDSLPDLHL
jgi:hypothetical protein